MTKMSIITATYNSEAYLEDTIRSVLRQDYDNVEYIIIDGGSTDGTVDIIRKYADHLAYWVSEPDAGMYDAMQKGFDRSTGDVMAWLNSDDKYPEWTLKTVASVFGDLPDVEWITSIRPMIWDVTGRAVDCMAIAGYSKRGFMRGEHIPNEAAPFVIESIQQESTFWRRSLWERAGSQLDTSYRWGGDYELWARFYQHAELYGVRTVLGGFRVHDEQGSGVYRDTYMAEVERANQHYGVQRHSAFSAYLRQHIAPKVPSALRRVAHSMGILHRTQILTFDMAQGRWQKRTEYI